MRTVIKNSFICIASCALLFSVGSFITTSLSTNSGNNMTYVANARRRHHHYHRHHYWKLDRLISELSGD